MMDAICPWVRPVLSLLGVFLACSAILCFHKREELVGWVAVRLLAYRDALRHRRSAVADWNRDLNARVFKP